MAILKYQLILQNKGFTIKFYPYHKTHHPVGGERMENNEYSPQPMLKWLETEIMD